MIHTEDRWAKIRRIIGDVFAEADAIVKGFSGALGDVLTEMPVAKDFFSRNCAVRERTGDGVSVGRCWFHTERIEDTLTCPRHGDVTEIQKRFDSTGELGEDPRGA